MSLKICAPWDVAKIVIVLGYKAETVHLDGAIRVVNADFPNNNILHSFMCARENSKGPVIASYSDFREEPEIYRTLVETDGEIVA